MSLVVVTPALRARDRRPCRSRFTDAVDREHQQPRPATALPALGPRDGARDPSEVIVVDNASDDGSVDMVEREFPACRLIRLAQREGYGASHNHAIARAAGKYV